MDKINKNADTFMNEHPVKDEKTFTVDFKDDDTIDDVCEWCKMMEATA